jgi:hypothetical protein
MPYIPIMPKNRTFSLLGAALLVPLAAWAQTPSEPAPAPVPASAHSASTPPAGSVQAAQPAQTAPPEEPTPTEKYLDAAIKAIEALKTVSADVRQKVDMLDQAFEITGRYRKGPEHRVYLYLKVSGLPDSGGEMLQVCDGKVLWDTQQVLDTKSYRRIEITQLIEKLKAPELDESLRQQIINNIGLSGPEELLKGLRKSVSFSQPMTSVTIDGKPFWALRGDWKSREGLTGPNQAPLPPIAPLPAYVPSIVTVYLGKTDNWPYKVRLAGLKPSIVYETRKIGPDGRPIGSASSIQQVKPTTIELTYENVKLNGELSDDEFVFTAPNNARVDDQTQAVLGQLDQEIQRRGAQKKAEAAKAEDPLLKEPILIPRADGPAPAAPAPLSPR